MLIISFYFLYIFLTLKDNNIYDDDDDDDDDEVSLTDTFQIFKAKLTLPLLAYLAQI